MYYHTRHQTTNKQCIIQIPLNQLFLLFFWFCGAFVVIFNETERKKNTIATKYKSKQCQFLDSLPLRKKDFVFDFNTFVYEGCSFAVHSSKSSTNSYFRFLIKTKMCGSKSTLNSFIFLLHQKQIFIQMKIGQMFRI